jgi:3-dehydroquinate dehydratase-2
MTQLAAEAGHRLSAFQSNSESELIERIHQAPAGHVAFIIFNPAGFTHTSIVLRDALLSVKIPFIEVHLSNVQARESFRHQSYFSDIAVGTITGLGPIGYELALRAAAHHLAEGPAKRN